VYLFRDGDGRVLYVGKATNLRSRVRSYFSTEERRKVGSLLRETERIDHKRTPTPLEAAVLEIRLIHHLEPRFNREGTRWRSNVFVKLTAEKYPRLSVVKAPADDGATYLGPLSSRRVANLVVEAITTVVPLRRCTRRPGGRGPCIPAQIGVSRCTCTGDITVDAYRPIADAARRGMTTDPASLLDPLVERMALLAAEERFEEAALTRDRAIALCEAFRRQRLLDNVRAAEVLVVADRSGNRYEFARGRLTRFWEHSPGGDDRLAGIDPGRVVEARPADPGPPEAGPLDVSLCDELLLAARWLERNAHTLRVEHVVGEWQSPRRAIPLVKGAQL
jgi:DNA polymerase-3 subunit epsilon